MSPAGTSTKSPAAPSRSLGACWDIASKIYDSYSHNEFGAPEIAGIAGMSATSGPAKGLVSDLKQYGLIEKTKAGRFIISQEMKDAHAMVAGSPEFKASMYEFVKRPAVFQRLLVDVKGKLPDETVLANNLRSTYQFNPRKAKSAAKALSESLELSGVLDAKRNIIESRLKKVASAGAEAEPNDSDSGDAIEEADDRIPSGRLLTLDIPLADGRTAHVRYPFDLTPDEAKKIGAVLAAICS